MLLATTAMRVHHSTAARAKSVAGTDLRGVERKVHALWDAIQRATESGDWRPRRGRLCDWCDHQARCPEFGGTPPPYPLQVGPVGVPEQSGGVSAPAVARE